MFPGHFVAQVRLVFRPIYNTPGMESEYLAYVEPFCPIDGSIHRGKHVPNPNSQMFHIKRDLNKNNTRKGMVVRLTDIWCQIDVIPYFGSRCSRMWSSETAVERAKEFILNSFFDKDTFACLISMPGENPV